MCCVIGYVLQYIQCPCHQFLVGVLCYRFVYYNTYNVYVMHLWCNECLYFTYTTYYSQLLNQLSKRKYIIRTYLAVLQFLILKFNGYCKVYQQSEHEWIFSTQLCTEVCLWTLSCSSETKCNGSNWHMCMHYVWCSMLLHSGYTCIIL